MGSAFPEVPDRAWFKSSYSGGNQTECVEAAAVAGGAAVRDSKRPLGSRIAFGACAWTDFVAALRDDRLA